VNRALRLRLIAVLATLSAAAMLCTPAQATPIPLGPTPGTTHYQDGVLVWPASFDVREFVGLVAGTITLTVQRTDWGDLLSQLSTTIALPTRADLHLNNTGSATTVFDITAGEVFATSIFAQAAGPGGFGAYQLDILFIPSVSQVPLPAAGWLLLSGLGLIFVVNRRRRGSSRLV